MPSPTIIFCPENLLTVLSYEAYEDTVSCLFPFHRTVPHHRCFTHVDTLNIKPNQTLSPIQKAGSPPFQQKHRVALPNTWYSKRALSKHSTDPFSSFVLILTPLYIPDFCSLKLSNYPIRFFSHSLWSPYISYKSERISNFELACRINKMP